MKKIGIFLLFVALLVVGFAGLRSHYSTQMRDARGFCESIIPKLETAHTRTGRYPTNLDTILLQTERLPALLRSTAFYESDGGRYSFTFREPLAWNNIWTYTSGEKMWIDYD